jgi:hypothetical protein
MLHGKKASNEDETAIPFESGAPLPFLQRLAWRPRMGKVAFEANHGQGDD